MEGWQPGSGSDLSYLSLPPIIREICQLVTPCHIFLWQTAHKYTTSRIHYQTCQSIRLPKLNLLKTLLSSTSYHNTFITFVPSSVKQSPHNCLRYCEAFYNNYHTFCNCIINNVIFNCIIIKGFCYSFVVVL